MQPSIDFRFKRADAVSQLFILNAKSGNLDLTGCSAWMQFRTPTGRLIADVSANLTIDNTEIPETPWIKTVALNLTAAETALIEPGTHLTDLEILWSDGSPASSRTLFVEVLDDQTKRIAE